jgi:hypothetical protein
MKSRHSEHGFETPNDARQALGILRDAPEHPKPMIGLHCARMHSMSRSGFDELAK